MTADASLIMSVVGAIVGIVVWFVRLEGRVNSHDGQIVGIKDDVRYIRDRIDRALDGGHP